MPINSWAFHLRRTNTYNISHMKSRKCHIIKQMLLHVYNIKSLSLHIIIQLDASILIPARGEQNNEKQETIHLYQGPYKVWANQNTTNNLKNAIICHEWSVLHKSSALWGMDTSMCFTVFHFRNIHQYSTLFDYDVCRGYWRCLASSWCFINHSYIVLAVYRVLCRNLAKKHSKKKIPLFFQNN